MIISFSDPDFWALEYLDRFFHDLEVLPARFPDRVQLAFQYNLDFIKRIRVPSRTSAYDEVMEKFCTAQIVDGKERLRMRNLEEDEAREVVAAFVEVQSMLRRQSYFD